MRNPFTRNNGPNRHNGKTADMQMDWYIMSLQPMTDMRIDAFPFFVGRNSVETGSHLRILNDTVSRRQFVLEQKECGVFYHNLSEGTPAKVDGVEERGERLLSPDTIHIVKMGYVTVIVGTNHADMAAKLVEMSREYYVAMLNGRELDPMCAEELLQYCENGTFGPATKCWCLAEPDNVMNLSELVDFQEEQTIPTHVTAGQTLSRRNVTAEEAHAVLGESFICPYCRTVTDIADMFSVSTSPSLLGDPVLGEGEQRRFLPTQFTSNGLALDLDGGVCTEIACPRCHMALPRAMLDTPQMVMSVIGAAGAGKSVFLASAMWQCRQLLPRLFGVSFMDLDPVANRWINAYEEKLFFQEDDQSLQQIEKTDLQASNVCRSVMLDGESVLLPLPSFFQVRTKSDPQSQSLVIYDSAGEHFRAGADTQASAVTLNMLNADALFFMFDPSADPRYRLFLNRGGGTAQNYAQRQDVLLAEIRARILRHMGNKGEARLSKPLIFGVAKSDLLRDKLPLDAELYSMTDDGRYALNIAALRSVSADTEAFLAEISPEVVNTAHDIASEVWFIPISALGHNPMREGVRPCDIKPLWTELPVVFTLAKKGLVPTIGSF